MEAFMLTLDFINVGYGDAILVRESGFTMLIDCGDCSLGEPSSRSRRISAADFLAHEKIRSLDLLVLTHLHLDHTGGLETILKHTRIRRFIGNYLPSVCPSGFQERAPTIDDGSFDPGTSCLIQSLQIFTASLKRMKEQGTEINLITRKTVLQHHNMKIFLFGGKQEYLMRQAKICDEFIKRRENAGELKVLDHFINDTSSRIRIEYQGVSVELPGDTTAACWEKCSPHPCDLVKLPHHGHSDSMTESLLKRLTPADAVISVSDDRHDNCPDPNVIHMLESEHCPVFFTDSLSPVGKSAPDYHQSVRCVINDSGQYQISYAHF
jgi:hypothetical protein